MRGQLLIARRRFLGGMGSLLVRGAVLPLLAACAPAAPTPTPAKPAEAPKAPAAPTPTPAPAQPTTGQTAGVCTMDWHPTYPPFAKYTPPIEISTIAFGTGAPASTAGLLPNPYDQRLRDQLGIIYTVHWAAPPGGPWAQKLLADIAAGTLADIIPMYVSTASGGFVGPEVLASMINRGAVEEIRGIFEATATTLTKQKKTYPDGVIWNPLWRGDRLYGLAWTNGPAYNSDSVGWIRQDLLDKVGMKAPETLDELTEVLRALKKSKLTAFGIPANQGLISWKNSLDPIFGAFGAIPGIWRRWSGGDQLEYGSIQPGVKEALKVLRSWYAEGLIDPDYYTYGPGPSWQQVAQGRVGVFFGPWWIAGGLYAPGGTLSEHPDWRFANFPAAEGSQRATGAGKSVPGHGDGLPQRARSEED